MLQLFRSRLAQIQQDDSPASDLAPRWFGPIQGDGTNLVPQLLGVAGPPAKPGDDVFGERSDIRGEGPADRSRQR